MDFGSTHRTLFGFEGPAGSGLPSFNDLGLRVPRP